jgi:hypothetical protein
MRNVRRSWLAAVMLALGLALAVAALAPMARADAPGSGSICSPSSVPDVLTAQQAAQKAAADAVYQRWSTRSTADAQAPIVPEVPIPISRVLITPSHKQANGHYCGPATVQIICGYWGHAITQSAAATYMGTTTDGTDFTLVDNALRHFTGKNYTQAPICTVPQDVYDNVQFAIGYKSFPAAGDYHIIGTTWNRYTRDHKGHIITTEGYAWKVGSSGQNEIRINDSFNEADYYANGGQTYGHQWYPRGQVADGVLKSTSPADRRFLIY